MIAVVDYGVGNVPSVINMLRRIGVQGIAASNHKILLNATKVILPGVGAFDAAVSKLEGLGLRDVLVEIANHKKIPILGICLGMQLMSEGSEEGVLEGLNLIPGIARRLPKTSEHKVPHMGWNHSSPIRHSRLLSEDIAKNRYYFAHSYYLDPTNESDIVGVTSSGIDFCSAVERDNVFGVQFHPEKSHRNGLQLLKNFVMIDA